MSIEQRVSKLEMEMKNLQLAFDSMQRRQVNTTGKVDDTSNKVEQITPYTETKTAYIGDTEVIFENVPSGNLSIFGLLSRLYRVERDSDKVTITLFEPLEDVTEVTISIQ